MKISEILMNGKTNISFELFPPKSESEFITAKETVRKIAKLSPAFMSVTYGAAGTRAEKTVEIADVVQNECSVTALAHLTCVTASRQKVKEVLTELKKKNIENILALRGDLPVDSGIPLSRDYKHANELVSDIKSFGDFCVGGACYPEVHPESHTLQSDIDNLKKKTEAGCDFLTTQMFFDNNIFYTFMYRLLKSGITVPVIPGIMPVTNASQLERSVSLSGCSVPKRFKDIVDRFADDPAAMKQAGIAYATDQIIDLIANGVSNIHIYTMNKPDIAAKITENLSEIIK